MILAGHLATPQAVQRFRQEARAAATLQHPHIVAVHEVREYDGEHYFAMELVEGGSLAERHPTEPREIARLLTKVARALAYAHEKGVLHRGVKPSNILLAPSPADALGEPKLTDFGLAKLTALDLAITHSHALLGSPSYMAPEQAQHDAATAATDIYGIGAVLYELLAAQPPFTGRTPIETLRRVVDNLPTPLPAAVPRDLATICAKCLEKEPARRYSSALALAEDFECFLQGRPVRARPLAPHETFWRWCRRRPALAALGVVFLAGFIGITWKKRDAVRAQAAQQVALERLEWKEIVRQAETDEAPVALARLAAILRREPSRWQAAMLAMSIVDQRAFPVPAGPAPHLPARFAAPPQLASDGSWYAVAGDDQSVRLHEVATGRVLAKLNLSKPAGALAVSDGPLALAVATEDGMLGALSRPGAPLQPLPRSRTSTIVQLLFSGDGRTLAARTAEGVEWWSCAAPLHEPQTGTLEGGDIRGATLSSDGLRLFA